MNEQRLRSICAEHAITVSLTGLVRESDVARLLDVNVRTLQNWRRDSCGPACVRMGGAWRYPIEELAEFMTPADELEKGRRLTSVSVRDANASEREDTVVTAQKVEP